MLRYIPAKGQQVTRPIRQEEEEKEQVGDTIQIAHPIVQEQVKNEVYDTTTGEIISKEEY